MRTAERRATGRSPGERRHWSLGGGSCGGARPDQIRDAERSHSGRLGQLERTRRERSLWLENHPEAARRLDRLDTHIEKAEHPLRLARDELNREWISSSTRLSVPRLGVSACSSDPVRAWA